MAELYNPRDNNTEPFEAYASSADLDSAIVTPPSVITEKKPSLSTERPIKKKSRRLRVIILVVAILFMALIIYLAWPKTSSLISKYENKSNFTNKDQYENPIVDDYNIHYLVEQMIYKEFSPKDKKKYLTLPQTLKEQLMIDYLIEKI